MSEDDSTATEFDREWVRSLPKTELHVHLVGATSPLTVVELARRHPQTQVPTELDDLERFYTFRDFDSFVQVYQAVSGLVTSGEDVTVLIDGLARDFAEQGVRYAEVTVTAATQLADGIEPDELSEAMENGRRAASGRGVEIAWVIDVHGGLGPRVGDVTIDWLTGFAPPRTIGFGLGGPEKGVPRSTFAPHFAAAHQLGLRSLPHAGETTGPETVWSALRDLGAERIGHGIAAAQDQDLMAYLAGEGITLEVCPTSNLCTGAVADLERHPLRQLMDAGVPITLSTDDPGMFGTDLVNEYLVAQRIAGLTSDEIISIVRQGIDASYCDERTRNRLHDELAISGPPLHSV